MASSVQLSTTVRAYTTQQQERQRQKSAAAAVNLSHSNSATEFTRAISAKQRRAYISFIISRERERDRHFARLKCRSADSFGLPVRAATVLGSASSSSSSSTTARSTSRTANERVATATPRKGSNCSSSKKPPTFAFSHNQSLSLLSTAGNNLEKEQRDRENNNKEKSLKDDGTNNSILPPASLHCNAKNGGGISLTSNGFRPMNSRNTFLGGQQITPTLPSQQRSSNTSSSHSEFFIDCFLCIIIIFLNYYLIALTILF